MKLKLHRLRTINLIKVSILKFFVALVLLLPTFLKADTVIVTDNGNGTVTMANNEVSMTFSKADGSVSSFYLAGLPTTNLIDSSQDYALSLTHIGSGTNDYWVSINSPGVPTYTVVTNTGQIADVMLENPIASGNASLYPNGIWDWVEHHVMRAGEAGFYTYWVWRHTANQPAAYYDADSWQGRTSSIFNAGTNADGSTYDAWSFSGSDVPAALSIGVNPPGSTSAGVPQEVVILPYTNYWTQPAGTNYEPGWPAYTQPCGLTSALYPTWTKYDYSSYEGASNSFRNVWGISTDQIGLWSILGSFEFVNGGPTKLKGAVSGNYLYNDDYEGHGIGSSPAPSAPAGAIYTKVIGPYFMYANVGTNHLQLWQDAQNEGAMMVSNWPYAWMDESEQDYPRHRGTVTGTITAKTGEPTANPVVILGNADAADGDWMYQGASNYLFWTTGAANGNFSIPKVRPGNYVLFSYVPGIWGELQISNIVVTADQTNKLGVIAWNPPHLQQRLWRVGTPDHTSKEFRFGNLQKQYGLWWRYLNEMSTNNLNFVIGQSVESNNWYYAQPEMWLTPQSGASNLTDPTQTNFTAWSPIWNVIFNLTNLPPTNVLCTVALAGCNGCYFYPYINGVNQTPNISGFSNPSQGVFTTSGDDIYRDVVTTGRYQYYQFSFPSSDFVVGTNTFSIHIRQPGLSSPVNAGGTNGYPDLIIGGLIYDFLQMETGPQVIIANPPAAPGGLAVTVVSGCEIDLTWTNNATNATSVVIQRSTDGVNYTQVGATANNGTNYADTTLSPGTAYYYEVLANNADGNSPVSNAAQASTQAAQPPAAPSSLTATAISTNQINLKWINNASNEDGFNLERSTNGGNYATIAMTVAGVTNYSDTGLVPSTTYFYRVQAFRSCWGNSAYTAPVSATTFTPAPPPPVTPAGLVAVPGNARVTLSWLGSSSATNYNLKRATTSGNETTLISAAGTNYTDTAVVNGTTYYYVVSAVNGGGEGNNSREASATPLPFATAYWTNRTTSAAQSWNANANWTNTAAFPNVTSIVANVTANITANQTINLNQNVTVGWLNLGAANGSSTYTIAPNGGSLTFANGTNNGAGLVELATSAGDTISAPITLSNNLTAVNNSTHTFTLSGTISGTNAVNYVGPGPVSLTVSNGYTGGTLISGATVSPANFNADSNAFGTGPITLDQGTLNLYSDNNTYNYYNWNLVVPTNTTGTVNADGRSYMRGTLTGGGTLNFNPPYVRVEIDGSWSAFTGQINTSISDFRFNNANGIPNAKLYVGGDAAYSLTGSMAVGEISGSATATLTTTAWAEGGLNTSATFAGIITGNSITKVGTGTWTLTGNNTYTGTTTISGGALQIGAGGNTGTLGTGSVTDNASLVFNLYINAVCLNSISGSGSLTQAGFGGLTLSAADTYSGATYITAGTLALTNSGSVASSTNINLANGVLFDVSGTANGSMSLGNGKMISGDGSVNGNFTVAYGATLAPGNNDLGELSFNNSLTLNPGSKTILSVSHDFQTNNVVSVNDLLTLGGSLIVSNADDSLQAGDSFQLFNARGYSGAFFSVTLPALAPGLYWDTSTLNTAGFVRVVVETSPTIGSVGISGSDLILSGAGGVTNGTYYVLTSTNLAAPLTNWTRLVTNQFDGGGNFNFTNALNTNSPQSFYLLHLP